MDVTAIRRDFPILNRQIHGQPLVYLDNAATTHKPRPVLEAMMAFCRDSYGNAHRGAHTLSDEAGAAYEDARERVRRFIHAAAAREIVFTRGTTESINLVADSFGRRFVEAGDEILVTTMEHHSNIVPWQVLGERTGAVLKSVPLDDDGHLQLDQLEGLITERTRLMAVTCVSNVTGVVNDLGHIVRLAHERNVPVLVDGAQAVQHMPVDVQALDCDFFAFSGHKMYADTGIGILYGKEKWLEAMPPYQTGGGMIDRVRFDHTSFAELPYKFEAGTGNVVAAVSLAAAIDYLEGIGLDKIAAHEQQLMAYATVRITALDGVRLYGRDEGRCGALSFNLENIHPFDVGAILDELGIAVRTGAHCAEPLMDHFGVAGMIRASLAVYNTPAEIDRLLDGLQRARAMLAPDLSVRRGAYNAG